MLPWNYIRTKDNQHMCLHWEHSLCKACRNIALDGTGDVGALAALCEEAVQGHSGPPCMCIPYARACVTELASKECTQRYAAVVLAAWPSVGRHCVFAAMAAGNEVELQWLLGQQPAPNFACYVHLCNRQLLEHRTSYTTSVMLVLVRHGWCPWASSNPGVTLEVLQTAAWAARKRYAGVHPDVMAFLPMCTMPGCYANHGAFDQRVLQRAEDNEHEWDLEEDIC